MLKTEMLILFTKYIVDKRYISCWLVNVLWIYVKYVTCYSAVLCNIAMEMYLFLNAIYSIMIYYYCIYIS